MHAAVLGIVADIIAFITVIDFIFDAVSGGNIVSIIRKMIRPTDNVYEAVKSQKRVTYFSIVVKLLSLGLLAFVTVFLNVSVTELILYAFATSIFIVNITLLVTKAIN